MNSARIAEAQTRIVKAIFPGSTNHYQTLFGGTALQWMDEIAFITATRYGRKRFVTVSTDRIDFQVPIPAGVLAELVGNVVRVGKTSLDVNVEIWLEEMYSEKRELAVSGKFSLVAVDEHKKPIPID